MLHAASDNQQSFAAIVIKTYFQHSVIPRHLKGLVIFKMSSENIMWVEENRKCLLLAVVIVMSDSSSKV
jgi:hypothetical protein